MGYTPQNYKRIRELVTKQQLITMENTDINWTWPLPSRNLQTTNSRDITDLNLQATIIKFLRKETQKKRNRNLLRDVTPRMNGSDVCLLMFH